MNNLTNQVLVLKNGKKYFILRQAIYKDVTYYLGAELEDNEEDFTNNFIFLEKIEEDGKSFVKEVVDNEILEVLANNIKFD